MSSTVCVLVSAATRVSVLVVAGMSVSSAVCATSGCVTVPACAAGSIGPHPGATVSANSPHTATRRPGSGRFDGTTPRFPR